MSEERTYGSGDTLSLIETCPITGTEGDMAAHIRELLAENAALKDKLEHVVSNYSLSWYDVERLTKALSWQGYSTPESQEECCARWKELTRDLINSVLDDKARKTDKHG